MNDDLEVGLGSSTPSGLGVVLLVQREDKVRDRLRMVLMLAGFVVLEARDKLDALALCAEHQGPIDLVLAEHTLPELSVRLPELRPRVKLLFMESNAGNDLVVEQVRKALDQSSTLPE